MNKAYLLGTRSRGFLPKSQTVTKPVVFPADPVSVRSAAGWGRHLRGGGFRGAAASGAAAIDMGGAADHADGPCGAPPSAPDRRKSEGELGCC